VAVPLALLTLIVKTIDEGPVFYRQLRIGRTGKPASGLDDISAADDD